MIMGPLMNANKRKCKTQLFVCGEHIVDVACVHGFSNTLLQTSNSRSFAFICGQRQ
jgi:Ni,Fe-hydrogenase III large subunit